MAYRKFKEAVAEECADMFEHVDNIKKIILLSLIVGARETPESVKNMY